MEQLKPLLKHKFWILFGVALVLPIVGWFLATGTAKANIDERIAKISGTNVNSGANAANDHWIQAIEQVNRREEGLLKSASAFLWEEQKGLMVWPARIRSLVGELNYRDAIPERALNLYVSLYESEFERVRQVAQPYNLETDKGLVSVSQNVLHVHRNYQQWKNSRGTLTSEEMWDAQEDLWLLEALLAGIANTNKLADADSIAESYVRRIDRIVLMGGSKVTPGAPAAASDDESGAMAGHGMEMEMEQVEDLMDGDEGGMFGGGGRGGNIKVSFDAAEEFGPAAMVVAASENTSAAQSEDESGQTMMQQQQERRYIEDEELPFRTRGFYMELVIDHTKLPELLGELTGLRWPVEIVRVQQGEFTGGGGGGGGGMYGGQGAFAGGGSPGAFGGGPSSGHAGGAFPTGGAGFGRGGGGFGRPGGGFSQTFGGRPPMRTPMGGNRAPMSNFSRNPMGTQRTPTQSSLATALQDPVLAQVAIAGVMTLFENPKNLDADSGTRPVAPEPAAAPATETPADASGTLASDPAAAAPAEGAAQTPAIGLDGQPLPADPADPATTPEAAPAATENPPIAQDTAPAATPPAATGPADAPADETAPAETAPADAPPATAPAAEPSAPASEAPAADPAPAPGGTPPNG